MGLQKMRYRNFSTKLQKKWEGCSEVVPEISSLGLELISKIAQHAFLLFEIFPSQFNRAVLSFRQKPRHQRIIGFIFQVPA